MPQLDHPGGDWVLGGEPGEGIVQNEELFVRNIGLGRDIGQLDPTSVAAVLLGPLSPGGIHEDAAHGFRRCCEEVAAVVPAEFIGGPDQAEVGFVATRMVYSSVVSVGERR